MFPLEKCEPEVLRAWTTKLLEVGVKNIPALQAFVSTHPSWFNKFVMMDGSIMDDVFKELEDIDAMLKERDD